MIRCVGLYCMIPRAAVDLTGAPYCGEGTGETSLMRNLLDNLRCGDALVADSYYCTYWLLAACGAKGVAVGMNRHHKRENDPPGAVRHGKDYRTVVLPDRVQPRFKKRRKKVIGLLKCGRAAWRELAGLAA